MGVAIPQVITEDKADGAQVIDGGLRFDSSKNHYLTRTPSSAGNRRTFTISMWVKKCGSGRQAIFGAGTTNSTNNPGGSIYFDSSTGTLRVVNGGGTTNNHVTDSYLRDSSGWYHCVVAIDTTQSTSTNRVKLYINGNLQSSSGTISSQNFELDYNNTIIHAIGSRTDDGGLPASVFDGYMSQIYFIDGQQLDSSYFGYTDPLTNTWRPKKYNQLTVLDTYSAGVALTATTYTDAGSSNCTITNNGSVTSSSAGTNSFGLTNAADMTGAQRVDINMGNVSSTFFQSAWTLEMFFKTSSTSDVSWFVGTAQEGAVWQSGWALNYDSGSLRWNYDSPAGGSQKSLGIALSSNTWYFMRIQRTPGSSTALKVWVYSSPTTLVGSFSGTVSDTSTQTQNTLKIGDANGNANNLSANWQFANVMLTAGTVRKQEVPTLSSGVRVNNTTVSLTSYDNFGQNGFYLPFDGNSPIGQDQSGRGNNWTPVNFGGSNTLEKATGALPILNTDGGGKVARVGVRTDSNASSLVLALPLVGNANDISATIKGSGSNKTVTVNGNAAASSAQSNFYGGSFYFDGSADYLSLTTTSDFAFGTGDFTIEFWAYVPTAEASNLLPVFDNDYNSTGGIAVAIRQSDNFFSVGPQAGGAGLSYCRFNSTPWALNTWNHFAMTSNNGIYRAFINGNEVTTTDTRTTVNVSRSSGTTEIGRLVGQTSFDFGGYLQDLRVYKGVAKYTQNFIPASTDPDILPDTPSGVAYSSNVALVPSTDGAVAFDGSGDYLSLGGSPYTGFGTGDFTIECFIYSTSSAAANNGIYDCRYSASATGPVLYYIPGTGVLVFYNGSNVIIGSSYPTLTNKWTHVALVRSSGTTKLYIDGVQSGSSYSDSNNYTSGAQNGVIGAIYDGSGSFNGFISNLHVVNGTALYTSNFTPPTGPISSVANTKLLCCKSNSSATAADVTPGTITANGNAAATNFNPFTVNINTQRGQESGYATLNPLAVVGGASYSNGNLKVTGSTAYRSTPSTIQMKTGKWYIEYFFDTWVNDSHVGVMNDISPSITGTWAGSTANGFAWAGDGGDLWTNNGYYNSSFDVSFTTGDTCQIAFDADNGNMYFGKNGVWLKGANPSAGTGANWTGLTNGPYYPFVTTTNGTICSANFGQKPFKFPPPAGFQPLALANTPRPTIVRPDQYVGIATYTGTGSTRDVIVGFKPDLIWIKARTGTAPIFHNVFDTVRGVNSNGSPQLFTETADPETTYSGYGLSAVKPNGFTLISNGTATNASGATYVAWAWKAGGNSNTYNINDIGYSTASAAGLTAGTITPTGASVNTKSGFSIIGYTGTGNGSDTVPHGLGKAPSLIFVKSRNGTVQWVTYHSSLGKDYYDPGLNTTNAANSASNYWGSGGVTSTVFGLQNQPGGGSGNNSLSPMIAYCWAEIPGFSKFGSYVGNQSADGPTIITGFRPRFIMIKSTSAGTNWRIIDTERSKYNPGQEWLLANSANAEPAAERPVDILSNGFKIRVADGGDINYSTSALTYIYAAFAESPSFNLYGGQANAR